MSNDWDQRQREEFLEIAVRAKNEVCASYTLVSLGLQAYAANRKLELQTDAQKGLQSDAKCGAEPLADCDQ